MNDYTTEGSKLELRKRLSNENLFITFTKVDGTQRTMLCTLRQQAIPASEGSKGSRTFPTTSLAVYDLEAGAWRSFRWDSILKVETK